MVARLSHLNDSPYPRFYYFNQYLNRVVHQHLTLADYFLLPEYESKNKIAVFIRNPYDRAYSGFRQLQIDLQEQPKQEYPSPWIRDLVMKQLAENLSQLKKANFDFDRWIDLVTEDQIYESGRNSSFPLHPLHYWTHRLDKQIADFIGKVEEFEVDFRRLQSEYGIETSIKTNSNVVEIEGDARLNPLGYRYSSRMSRKSIDKINQIFLKDFQLFSYEIIKVP